MSATKEPLTITRYPVGAGPLRAGAHEIETRLPLFVALKFAGVEGAAQVPGKVRVTVLDGPLRPVPLNARIAKP